MIEIKVSETELTKKKLQRRLLFLIRCRTFANCDLQRNILRKNINSVLSQLHQLEVA